MTQKIQFENSSKYRVLVIDDEKRIRDGVKRMLTLEKFEVAVA